MIKLQEIKEFRNKLTETENVYMKLIEEKENEDMTVINKNTIKIWEDRVDAIEKMANQLDMLEFELFI
jgi:hypothetical protein